MEDDDGLEELTAIFILWYGSMLRAIHRIATVYLQTRVVNFAPVPLDDPAVAKIVLEARARAVAVDATTRKLIAERIAEGAARGLTARQIAYGTPDFPGIAGLFKETWKNRPLTVAKTELQNAQLQATVERFNKLARGQIDGWLASDGDYDSYCADRNGRVYPASDPPSLAHPHCRLNLTPIIRTV